MSSSAVNINPFLFLQPYGLNDHYKLMGREDEAQALLALLKWKEIIVVFGKSGVGKTSFINNTLSARINRVNWLPIRITRLLNINHSLKQGIQYALEEESLDNIHNKDLSTDTLAFSEIPFTGEDAVQLMKELYIKWNRPIYLIIDQLEELFLVGDKDEQTVFLETLQTLMDTPGVQKKIILVLREEHLGYIQEVERILYGVFQDAMAVRDIKKSDANDIFHNLLTTTNPEIEQQLNCFAQKISSEEIKNRIIESCSNGDSFNAQKLQILLFLLWEKIQADATPEAAGTIDFEVEKLCASPDPLKDYLDTTVNTELANGARLKKAPYWFLLHNAISDANTKKPVALSEFERLIWQSLGFSENGNGIVRKQKDLQITSADVRAWCDNMVDKRILQNFSITADGGTTECYFQLRHDTLVDPIKKLYTGLPLRFPKKLSPHKLVQNPYMGLRQYDYDSIANKTNTNAGLGRKNIPALPVLYGRETVINEYVEFLKKGENKYLVVVGDSGTGKSSLVKGGLLPAMQQAGFGTFTLQPGANLEAFTHELQLLFNKHATGSDSRHCLYIDQFEECYTFREATKEEKNKFESFLQFLTNEIDQRGGNFKLVVSIRHDYAHEFDRNISQWRKYKKLLRYPNQDEIFDIIVGPAYERGIGFQPASLPEIVAADAINTSYFLPLLSFTMETLYKQEVLDVLDKHLEYDQLNLTIDGYRKAGEIVKCLQNEFTNVYLQLPEADKRYFLEIMARMIIIKDTIPKARPLPVASLNYVEPCKADRVQQVLINFIPRFFREKDIIVDNCVMRCYEPIHDSLLIYCDEIRQIVNKVQEPGAQMYLQPKIEAAVKEWKGNRSYTYDILHESNEAEPIHADNKLLEIIHKRHRELEPLFELVMEDGKPAPGNWLFKDEWELVKAGKDYATELQNQEKMLMDQKMSQLKMEISQQKLLQEKVKAEQDLALAEEQKKKKELEVKAAQANATVERRSKWLIALGSLIIILGGLGYVWYSKTAEQVKNNVLIMDRQKDSLKQSREDAKEQAKYNASLAIEKRKTELKNDTLDAKISENEKLLKRLSENGRQLQKANKELENRKAELANALLMSKNANEELDSINKTYLDALRKVEEAEAKVRNITNARVAALAEYYKNSSPALSYQLAEEALKKAHDMKAMRIKTSLASSPQYFESLVVNNVISHAVSPDGSRIVTIEPAPNSASNEQMRVWSSDGKQLGDPVTLNEKIDLVTFSYDSKMIMLATDNSIRLYDVQRGILGSPKPMPDLLYARFAENDNRLLAISGGKLIIFDANSNSTNPEKIKELAFESEAVINSASFNGNNITLVTAKGVRHWDLARRNKSTAKNIAQSFIVNGTGKVLAFEKPLLGGARRLVLFNREMKEEWSIKVPDRSYNLITEFVPGNDGRFAIIKFNERENVIQYNLQNQQQQQALQKKMYSKQPDAKSSYAPPVAITGSLYSLDLSTGILKRIENWSIPNESFILSAQSDALFEFSTGSIIKYPMQLSQPQGPSKQLLSISDNTRFKQVTLAGPGKDQVLSLDANNQLKLWRYGKADDLSSKNLLYTMQQQELEKLVSVK